MVGRDGRGKDARGEVCARADREAFSPTNPENEAFSSSIATGRLPRRAGARDKIPAAREIVPSVRKFFRAPPDVPVVVRNKRAIPVVPSHSTLSRAMRLGSFRSCASRAAIVTPRRAPALRLRARPSRRASRRSLATPSAKLFYDANALGGDSAELKGAQTMRRLFTFVAIRVVQGHIEGLGNDGGFAPQATGMDGTSDCPDYDDLRWHMENVELGDGDSWISALMKKNPVVALRVLEARKAYCEEFDYDLLRDCVAEVISEGNVRLMQEHMTLSMATDANGAREPREGEEGWDRAPGPAGGRWG
jgi:hypothetical protein